jgi:hypothetical protein
MNKFGWTRVAILQQAEEVFISVSNQKKNQKLFFFSLAFAE